MTRMRTTLHQSLVQEHRTLRPRRIALVLGGGGLKGFAHIGVLRALEERGIEPALYAGASIGALLGAAHLCGMTVNEMADRALALKRRDLFRINHIGMLLERMRSSSIYTEEPLRALCQHALPRIRFDDLPKPLLVSTVDVERGTQTIWGLPGLRDVYVDEAVYASCSLPGFFPPGRVDGRVCIDGGTMDNLPVSFAARDADAVIAVDVGTSDLGLQENIAGEGFASIYMRAATIMMHALQSHSLKSWSGPPMILIRPRVSHIGWFSFAHTQELIDAGYRAAIEALDDLEICLQAKGGIFPRRVVNVSVDRARCTGCGMCVAIAPGQMRLDAEGKAFADPEVAQWTPADGEFVRQCPTQAISTRRITPVMEQAS